MSLGTRAQEKQTKKGKKEEEETLTRVPPPPPLRSRCSRRLRLQPFAGVESSRQGVAIEPEPSYAIERQPQNEPDHPRASRLV